MTQEELTNCGGLGWLGVRCWRHNIKGGSNRKNGENEDLSKRFDSKQGENTFEQGRTSAIQ